MRFETDFVEHLQGGLFSKGHAFQIATGERKVIDRLSHLESMVAGKRVIHLGCADHIPLIRKKIENNTWLHARLSQSAGKCIGIDINYEAIEIIRDEFGYSNVIGADISEDNIPEIMNEFWDYLVAGELLEHLDSPFSFLRGIRERYHGWIGKIIITVPNAFALNNVRHALRHLEMINTDHRYWFSPYTLAKLISQAGLKPEQFWLCEGFPIQVISVRSLVKSLILRKYPALRSTVVMEASLE